MKYAIRPTSDRTQFGRERRNSPFTATWQAAMDLLDRELWFLDAENVFLEVDVEARHIRRDGMLRADAKTATPAVRLAMDTNQGPLIYATDVFERPSWHGKGMREDWQHNLYAIAKALEALRLVDRYGVVSRGEQYAGFKALPAGRAMPSSHMTADQAREVITDVIGSFDPDPQHAAAQVRRARGLAHPDRHGGDRAVWDLVEEAGKLIGVLR